MESICGANCLECELFKGNKCLGCRKMNACPFGKKCFIANYIDVGGKENYDLFKKQLIEEINFFHIDGMPKITDLYPLNGSFVNLEYSLPNGLKVRFLDDHEIYLGNQVVCIYNDSDIHKCFGIIANMNFILICEYEEDGINPEILVFKTRTF